MKYFILSTAIWLLFLLCYELLLKRNKDFRFNRAYLLFAILAGIILPLFRFPNLFGKYVLSYFATTVDTGSLLATGATHVTATTEQQPQVTSAASFDWILLL